MPGVDDLSPDQRAVLQLLLKQGRSYDELAGTLRIDPSAVRDRAAAALAALAAPGGLDDGARTTLTDWLLGQGDAAAAQALMAGDPAARAWAANAAQALRAGGLEPRAAASGTATAAGAEGPPARSTPSLPGFGPADDDATARPRASRLGGALLLLGIAAVVAVVLVIVLSDGDDGEPRSTAGATTPTSTTSTTGQIQVEAQVNMTSPSGARKTLGVAQFFTDGKDHAVQVQAQGLRPNTKADRYALWLTGGRDGKTSLLGFSEARVGRNGRFGGSTTLPEDAASYRRIELTRETSGSPTTPGTVVLRGSLR